MRLTAKVKSHRLSIYRDGLALPLVIQNALPNQRPSIHPLLAPDGIGELTENEPEHHLWQHGLYVGLNDVNGVGFWTERLYQNPERDGTFHPLPLVPPTIDENRASWTVTTDWHSPDSAPMLRETQDWTLEDQGGTLTLDLDWTLRATVDLRFGAYSYGGLFLRMPWRAETKGSLRTSEGAATPADAEGKRARWVGLSMPIPGRAQGPAGIAILDHPSNPEHPVPWRVDESLGIGPSRCIAGEWQLAKDEMTISHFRVFAYKGPFIPGDIEAEWRRFAGGKKE